MKLNKKYELEFSIENDYVRQADFGEEQEEEMMSQILAQLGEHLQWETEGVYDAYFLDNDDIDHLFVVSWEITEKV
jgi:hypothetical protein